MVDRTFLCRFVGSAPVALPAPVISLLAESDTGTSNSDRVTDDMTPGFRLTSSGTDTYLPNDIIYIWKDSVKVSLGGPNSGHVLTTPEETAQTIEAMLAALAPGIYAFRASYDRPSTGQISPLSAPETVTFASVGLAAPVVALLASSDTGYSTSDRITSDVTPSLRITFPGLAEVNDHLKIYKDAVQVTLDGPGGVHVLSSADALADEMFAMMAALPAGTYAFTASYSRPSTGQSSPISAAENVQILTSPPALVSTTPVTGAMSVSGTAYPTVTFNRPVVLGTGIIGIYKTSDNSIVEEFDVATEVGTSPGQVSVTGATITIRQTTTLPSVGVYIKIAPTAVDDLAGNSYIGITNTTDWAFGVGVATGLAAPIIHLLTASDSGVSSSDKLTNIRTPGFQITFPDLAEIDDVLFIKVGGVTVDLGGPGSGHVITSPEATADTVYAMLAAMPAGAYSFTASYTRPSGSLVSGESAPEVITIDPAQPYITAISPSDVEFIGIIATGVT